MDTSFKWNSVIVNSCSLSSCTDGHTLCLHKHTHTPHLSPLASLKPSNTQWLSTLSFLTKHSVGTWINTSLWCDSPHWAPHSLLIFLFLPLSLSISYPSFSLKMNFSKQESEPDSLQLSALTQTHAHISFHKKHSKRADWLHVCMWHHYSVNTGTKNGNKWIK